MFFDLFQQKIHSGRKANIDFNIVKVNESRDRRYGVTPHFPKTRK